MLITIPDYLFPRNKKVSIKMSIKTKTRNDVPSLEEFIILLEDKLDILCSLETTKKCVALKGTNQEPIYPLHAVLSIWNTISSPPFAIMKELADVSVTKKKIKGERTALHLAALSNVNMTTFQLLIDLYPEAIKERNQFGQIPLHLTTDFHIAKLLINKCPETVMMADSKGRTPLHLAANVEVVKLLLSKYPSAVNVFDLQGLTPVHISVLKNKHTSVFEELVRVGLEVCSDPADAGGVLTNASPRAKNVFFPFEMIRSRLFWFIDGRGTRSNIGDIWWERYKICVFAISHSRGYKSGTFLHNCLAIETDPSILIDVIRREHDQISTVDGFGRLPLSVACMKRSIPKKVIELLLSMYKDAAYHADDFKKYAIHYAIESGRTFTEGTESIVLASSATACIPNPDNNFFTFMDAAAMSDLNTIYGLICIDPKCI